MGSNGVQVEVQLYDVTLNSVINNGNFVDLVVNRADIVANGFDDYLSKSGLIGVTLNKEVCSGTKCDGYRGV